MLINVTFNTFAKKVLKENVYVLKMEMRSLRGFINLPDAYAETDLFNLLQY